MKVRSTTPPKQFKPIDVTFTVENEFDVAWLKTLFGNMSAVEMADKYKYNPEFPLSKVYDFKIYVDTYNQTLYDKILKILEECTS